MNLKTTTRVFSVDLEDHVLNCTISYVLESNELNYNLENYVLNF